MKTRIQEYLREDIGSGDIMSELVIPPEARAKGKLACNEDCVLAGVAEASAVLEEDGAKVVVKSSEGVHVKMEEIA